MRSTSARLLQYTMPAPACDATNSTSDASSAAAATSEPSTTVSKMLGRSTERVTTRGARIRNPQSGTHLIHHPLSRK